MFFCGLAVRLFLVIGSAGSQANWAGSLYKEEAWEFDRCGTSHCKKFYVLLPELTLLDDLRHRASMFCRIIADGTIRETGRLVWEDCQHIIYTLVYSVQVLEKEQGNLVYLYDMNLYTIYNMYSQCLILCLSVWLGSYPSWTWGCSHSTTCSICLSDFEELHW